MKKTSFFTLLIIVVVFLSSCSTKLSEKNSKFTANGYDYTFKLPDSWTELKDESYKRTYNIESIFGAEDSKSKSEMYILSTPIDSVDMNDFGKKNRKKLKEAFNYKEEENVYFKETKIDDKPTYLYTVNGEYKGASVWIQFYYVVTEHNLIQFIFYSADDGAYEKRATIIDESVETLKEQGKSKNEKKQNSEENEENSSSNIIQSDELSFNVNGYRKITVDGNDYLAIRYQIKNKGDQSITPEIFYNEAVVKQGDKILVKADFPKSDDAENLKELAKNNEDILQKDEELTGLAFYSLPSKEEKQAKIEFPEDKYKRKDIVVIDLTKFE